MKTSVELSIFISKALDGSQDYIMDKGMTVADYLHECIEMGEHSWFDYLTDEEKADWEKGEMDYWKEEIYWYIEDNYDYHITPNE